MKTLASLAVILVAIAAIPAAAGTLTFPNNICSANTDGSGPIIACVNYGYINQAYGDTAQLDVQYVDRVVPGNSLRWWSTGYNNLPSAAWGGTGDLPGQSDDSIILLPAAGYSVTLNSFDMGAYYHAVLGTNIIITEVGTGNTLLDFGPQTIGVGDLAVSFFPNVTSSHGIDIRWYDTAYNVGIDNIDYSVTPEPATLGMLGFGLVTLASRVRRLLR